MRGLGWKYIDGCRRHEPPSLSSACRDGRFRSHRLLPARTGRRGVLKPRFDRQLMANLEMRSVKYAIRLRVIGLASRIGYLLKRPVRLLLNEMRRFYAKFAYRGPETGPSCEGQSQWHPDPRIGNARPTSRQARKALRSPLGSHLGNPSSLCDRNPAPAIVARCM
jgi:hypothetical protein